MSTILTLKLQHLYIVCAFFTPPPPKKKKTQQQPHLQTLKIDFSLWFFVNETEILKRTGLQIVLTEAQKCH